VGVKIKIWHFGLLHGHGHKIVVELFKAGNPAAALQAVPALFCDVPEESGVDVLVH
jgi:hypothetical protein